MSQPEPPSTHKASPTSAKKPLLTIPAWHSPFHQGPLHISPLFPGDPDSEEGPRLLSAASGCPGLGDGAKQAPRTGSGEPAPARFAFIWLISCRSFRASQRPLSANLRYLIMSRGINHISLKWKHSACANWSWPPALSSSWGLSQGGVGEDGGCV